MMTFESVSEMKLKQLFPADIFREYYQNASNQNVCFFFARILQI